MTLRAPAVVFAPNAFKGSLTAREAAEAMAKGFKRVFSSARCVIAPMADGGDGTMPVLASALDCTFKTLRVPGPLGNPVNARFAVAPERNLAIIEMAEAGGLRLLKRSQFDPLQTGTFGLGRLMQEARRLGCRQLVIGVGGSATVDGGLGMAEALGFRLSDAQGNLLPGKGASLDRLSSIQGWEIRRAWQALDIRVAVDVNNPLFGPKGAARVFGPQKGATPAMARRLDAGLKRLAALFRKELGIDFANIPGCGAAGGLAAGLLAFCDARITPGFELVAEMIGLRDKIRGADLVVTGEGFLDSQTQYGKVPFGVAKMARACHAPVLCFAGGLADDLPKAKALGMDAVLSIIPRPMSLEDAMQSAAMLLADAVERAARCLAIGCFPAKRR